MNYVLSSAVRYWSVSAQFRYWNRNFSILSVSYRYWYWKKYVRGIGIGLGIAKRVSEVLVLVLVLKPDEVMVLVLYWYRRMVMWSIGIVSKKHIIFVGYWYRYWYRTCLVQDIGIGFGLGFLVKVLVLVSKKTQSIGTRNIGKWSICSLFQRSSIPIPIPASGFRQYLYLFRYQIF